MYLLRALCVGFSTLSIAAPARPAEPKTYLQPNISAAIIAATPQGYKVDVTILASDFEEMFLKTAAERRGVDLSSPSARTATPPMMPADSSPRRALAHGRS